MGCLVASAADCSQVVVILFFFYLQFIVTPDVFGDVCLVVVL